MPHSRNGLVSKQLDDILDKADYNHNRRASQAKKEHPDKEVLKKFKHEHTVQCTAEYGDTAYKKNG